MAAQQNIESILPELVALRQELHQYPELSGQENQTAERLIAYLQKYPPAQLYTQLGAGTGIAAVYEGKQPGPTVFFRADMDALPIPEAQSANYSSCHTGISHKCGHDGHMTMVAGLAPLLHQNPLKKGKVVLFMQAAEETGQGAKELIADEQFRSLQPDYIFGLHNLPGFPLGQTVVREGTFCAASKGLKAILSGRTAHAAEPDKGLSPATALASLLLGLPKLPKELAHEDLLLLTITHANLGEPTFGTSPGEALLQITLRANQQEDMDRLTAAVEQQIKEVARDHGLTLQMSYHEVFAVTSNSTATYQIMRNAATKAGLDLKEPHEPFRWSEDFGYYNELAPAGFFGLGAGIEQPNLHNVAYDFPDALIPHGIRMYQAIINEVMQQ